MLIQRFYTLPPIGELPAGNEPRIESSPAYIVTVIMETSYTSVPSLPELSLSRIGFA